MAISATDVLNMSGRNPESVHFGPFTFIPGDGLRRDGRPVPLPPRAIGVLTALLEAPGDVVTKQALMDAVWPGTFVTEPAFYPTLLAIFRAAAPLIRFLNEPIASLGATAAPR